MTTIDDNSFTIVFEYSNQIMSHTITYTSDIHSLFGIPVNIKSMTLGKNLSCYGMALLNNNNQILKNYQHFASGHYEFSYPFTMVTFHLISVV